MTINAVKWGNLFKIKLDSYCFSCLSQQGCGGLIHTESWHGLQRTLGGSRGRRKCQSLLQVFKDVEGLDLEEMVFVFSSTHYVASAVQKWALSQGGAGRKIDVTKRRGLSMYVRTGLNTESKNIWGDSGGDKGGQEPPKYVTGGWNCTEKCAVENFQSPEEHRYLVCISAMLNLVLNLQQSLLLTYMPCITNLGKTKEGLNSMPEKA